MSRWFVVALVLAPLTARADETDTGGASSGDHPPVQNRINFRVGFSSADRDLNGKGHPTICLDVLVAYQFGVESCGTGEQLLHNEAGQEISHYRINYRLAERSLGQGTAHLRVGAGFAEMQVGKDNPGFVFGKVDADRGSVSGPEAAVSAQWLVPMYRGFDFVVTATGGLAYFAHAGELATTKSDLQSFAALEAGVGW